MGLLTLVRGVPTATGIRTVRSIKDKQAGPRTFTLASPLGKLLIDIGEFFERLGELFTGIRELQE